jgi:Tubulin like
MLTRTESSPLQPTLSLYLGGSGIVVGKSLLKMMASLSKHDRRMIEPFFIDSQEPDITDHSRAQHFCYRDLNQFFQPTFQEFTENRFPANLGANPIINSSEGCGITRIFGAASLVNCRDDFANLVDQATAQLRARRTSSKQPMQVFLTASSCGGTGAGMIIDAAALVRHFFRERGENPRIFLFLIGPTVYLDDPKIPLRQDQRDRMRASTYALLKELHHFAQGNPFRSAYRLRDKVVDIGNVRDDDRLFEWVYYLDGRPELAGPTRSLDEVAWTIAETQLHLCVTEVGRKVAEMLPNQREERMRDYAPDFIHADNKDRLSDGARSRLKRASRKTFLASFSVRNVRFPAEEIKTFFIRGWVREALQMLLNGKPTVGDEALVDRFDALLGFSHGAIQPEGLFAELGLLREQMLSRVNTDANPAEGLPPAPVPGANPDRILDGAKHFLDAARVVVDDLKRAASLIAKTTTDEAAVVSSATLLANAVPGWKDVWREGLGSDGIIARRFWDLACDPAHGHGLHFVDDLLAHAAEMLDGLATGVKKRPRIVDLAEMLDAAQLRLSGLTRKRDLEQRGLRAVGRNLLLRFKLVKTVHSEVLRKSMRALTKDIESLRQQVIAHRATHVASALAPRAWLIAAHEIRRWRDEVLAPMITASENAFTLADNEWKLAHAALAKHRGVNERGRWEAHTTVQIADDALLASLAEHVSKVNVNDLVLAPLHDEHGIARERHRLTVRSLARLDRETTVAILFAHVKTGTQSALTFLDNGWMLPQVASRLGTAAAKALDDGSEPLVSFSRAALGQQLQGYLLTPPTLILPEPFGRRLGRMNRLASTDPLQLGVVSFVYGIPPNALEGIGELFTQYADHLGDQLRNSAHDRYPMHIFRNAAETFDEPHSPLEFQTDDATVQSVVAAAQHVWGNNGGIRLRIREWDEARASDVNRVIELFEALLLHLVRHPEVATQMFTGGNFPALARLYDNRRHRRNTAPAGNGG